MKFVIKCLLFVFLIVVSLESVFALGVIPGRTTINFEPGVSHEVVVRVLNNQKKDVTVLVSKSGGLSDYVVLDGEMIRFNSSETEKSFTYSVNLPQEIEYPGNHDVEISFVEVPDSIIEGETMIGGRPSVVSQLRVKVPYPGKYAEANLQITVLDDDVTFTIPIFNLGSDGLSLNANIRILESDDELAEITTDIIEVGVGESSKIVAHWSAPSVGNYIAIVEVDYGGENIILKKEFNVGGIFIKIKDIVFGEFKLGDIARMDVVVESGWNDMIRGVYADLFIKNKEGYTVAVLKTASYDIGALSEELLTAYWDTKGIGVGDYGVFIKLNYAGKWSEEIFEINIEEDYITKVTEIGPGIPIWVIITVAIIVLVIIGAYIYLRRKT